MASFTKRGSTWQYTVSRMVDGKSKPIRKGGFKTKKEAQVAAAEVESDLAKGKVPHLTMVSFSEYFSEWVKVYKSHLSSGTLKHYDYTLTSWTNHFGDEYIQNITKRNYQLFMNEFAKERAKETVDKVNHHIRACVRDAIDAGIISVDFTRNVLITPGTKPKRSHDKHLSYDDAKRLISLTKNKLSTGSTYYIILLAITSGLRYEEIVGLTRKDFDFDNNTIDINKTWGHKSDMHNGFGPTKNESSNRLIYMDHATMSIFKEYFRNNPENIERLIFYSPSSKYKVISNKATNKSLKKLQNQLKIKNVITFHGLRHTHASILIYKKVPIHYVSKRLGHESIETTLGTYTHVLEEMQREGDEETKNIMRKMYV